MHTTLIIEIAVAIMLVASVGLLANRLQFSVIRYFSVIGMVLGNDDYPNAVVEFLTNLNYPALTDSIDSIWRFLTFTESKPFIDFMGRLGVLFLLFYLGLEFSVGRLIKSGKSMVAGGVIYL